MELRCANKKHAEIIGGRLEVKCSSRFCGARSGVIVIHVYNTDDGSLVETRKYRDVITTKKEVTHGAR